MKVDYRKLYGESELLDTFLNKTWSFLECIKKETRYDPSLYNSF